MISNRQQHRMSLLRPGVTKQQQQQQQQQQQKLTYRFLVFLPSPHATRT